MRLYLDDLRDPKGDFDFVARTSNEAIRIMSIGCPSFVSFDFDLGEDRDGNGNKRVSSWYFSSAKELKTGYLNNATHIEKIESTRRKEK